MSKRMPPILPEQRSPKAPALTRITSKWMGCPAGKTSTNRDTTATSSKTP
jgi:hypothetical protein